PTQGQGPAATMEERLRPKKLPCGHVLHFACLRSWLERQQACPTCRRPVLAEAPNTQQQQQRANQPGTNNANGANAQPGQPLNNAAPNARQPGQQRNRGRVFNLGPFRFAFNAGPPGQMQEFLQQQLNAGQQANGTAAQNAITVNQTTHSSLAQLQLLQLERQINYEIEQLSAAQNQLYLVRALQAELARLRNQRNPGLAAPIPTGPTTAPGLLPPMAGIGNFGAPVGLTAQAAPVAPAASAAPSVLLQNPDQNAMEAGDANLPEGFNLPPGWSIVPLHRVEQAGEAPYPDETTSSISMPSMNITSSAAAESSQPAAATPAPEIPQTLQEQSTASIPTPATASASLQPSATEPLSPTPVQPNSQPNILAASHDAPSSTSAENGAASSNLLGSEPGWSFVRATPSPEEPAEETSRNGGAMPAGSTASQQTPETEGVGGGEESRDKGKGRAVTVEDTEDA
ncbi:hypothetical protein LTS18_003636, partial [Coniosporium uncinatum]